MQASRDFHEHTKGKICFNNKVENSLARVGQFGLNQWI